MVIAMIESKETKMTTRENRSPPARTTPGLPGTMNEQAESSLADRDDRDLGCHLPVPSIQSGCSWTAATARTSRTRSTTPCSTVQTLSRHRRRHEASDEFHHRPRDEQAVRHPQGPALPYRLRDSLRSDRRVLCGLIRLQALVRNRYCGHRHPISSGHPDSPVR